jgi:hypothetical protein
MKSTIEELNGIINSFSSRINAIDEQDFSNKPSPIKWSKKEVLGHLIDSGENNLRRFICGQYESEPPKIRYEQDFWVIANGYQQMSREEIIVLWKMINQRIATVLANMSVENYSKACDTGRDKPELHTLKWLAEDYVKHMKHHLNQIIPFSFNVVYN